MDFKKECERVIEQYTVFDDFTDERVFTHEPQVLAEAITTLHTKRLEEILKELDRVWYFDNSQQHLHTWHDKQDFMSKIRKTLDMEKENAK